MKLILSLAALSVLVSTSGALARMADCVFEVDGKQYMNGRCSYAEGHAKSFVVRNFSDDERLLFVARLSTDPTTGEHTASWNGTEGEGETDIPLGQMQPHGACWANDHAKICAWRWGEPRGEEYQISYPKAVPHPAASKAAASPSQVNIPTEPADAVVKIEEHQNLKIFGGNLMPLDELWITSLSNGLSIASVIINRGNCAPNLQRHLSGTFNYGDVLKLNEVPICRITEVTVKTSAGSQTVRTYGDDETPLKGELTRNDRLYLGMPILTLIATVDQIRILKISINRGNCDSNTVLYAGNENQGNLLKFGQRYLIYVEQCNVLDALVTTDQGDISFTFNK